MRTEVSCTGWVGAVAYRDAANQPLLPRCPPRAAREVQGAGNRPRIASSRPLTLKGLVR